jgi:hypothetical protein
MVEKDIGRIKRGEFQGTTTEIVIGIREYNGKAGVDIREFTLSSTYTGPTKKGLRIPADKFEEFKTMINSIKPTDLTSSNKPEKKQEVKFNPSQKSDEDSGIDENGYM